MGLVSERVPTMDMLKETHELIEHANYYRAIKGLGTDYSNDWLEINEDTLCVFREVSFLDEKRNKQIAARTAQGERFSDWILDEVARFPSIDGAVETTHYGRVISQGKRQHLYRGESRMWPASLPTMYRTMDSIENKEERDRYELCCHIRIAAFADFLLEFDSMQRWLAAYDLDLMPEPLAQHYGLDTPMLDLTDDFDIALFFATCCYDASKHQWRPLNENDFSRDPLSMYGGIFHIPRWNAEYVSTFSRYWDPDFDRSTSTFDHIGFQVFQRCHMQHGYGLRLDHHVPLQDNQYFEKLRFKHSAQLSNEVFELIDYGNKVFTDEGLLGLSDVINTIKNAWSFNYDEFELGYYYAGGDAKWGSKDNALIILRGGDCLGHSISITGDKPCYQLSRQRRRQIDRAYKDLDIRKAMGSDIVYNKPRMPY